MNKKLITSSLTSLLLLSQVVNAEIKFGDQKNPSATLAFNAGYNSTYVWRGMDQNSGSGSPYIGADLTMPIGFYLGTWTAASTAGLGNVAGAPNQEIDIYGGFAKSFGPITADVGVIEYRYPGSDKKASPNNFLEYYLKLKLAPDKAPYSLQVAYFMDDTEGQKNGTKKGNGKTYQEISGTYDLPFATLAASYGVYKDETDTTSVTLSKSLFDLNFALSYINADAKVATSSAANRTNSNKDFYILNVSKTF